MKVNICYDFMVTASGGGNQFLKSLKREFIKRGIYTDYHFESDILLYNGHHQTNVVQHLKSKRPEMKFVHRLDGLQKLYNRPDDVRQDIMFDMNKFADASVFQSEWILKQFKKFEFPFDNTHRIIGNAVDPDVFTKTRSKSSSGKKRLVTTCWSPNVNKGFRYYKFLDQNLDFDKYEYHFIGNLMRGCVFDNIIYHPPMSTSEIADFLPTCDVFITASKFECLSNSLIEALACKVPAIVLDSGSNPEVINNSGLTFKDEESLLKGIERLFLEHERFVNNICIPTIEDITDSYVQLFGELLNEK